MIDRRQFLGAVAGGMAATISTPAFAYQATERGGNARKRLAVVTTEWRYHSHAWHMAERFLVGYPIDGRWHQPQFEVVGAYVDQTPDNDLSRQRAEEFGFPLFDSVADAVCAGGDELAADAVLLIGEHGSYGTNEFGQKLYPRYELFKQVVEVFERDRKSVPVFNDKHLSWNWNWAEEMVADSRRLGFPLMAGSSLPVTWRMPDIDMPLGSDIEEVMCVAMGGVDSYDFHALEVIQCMAERRRGGETGVIKLEALRGEDVWKAQATGSWQAGGWDPKLFEACLCRSQTLAQPETFSHRKPTTDEIRRWVADPVVYRFEYADGLRATMLLMNGLVEDFTFAARIHGESDPLSTLFYLPPNPNVVYSAALMSKVESMFLTGKPTYPVERTLLTTGLVAAGTRSLTERQPVDTPHLRVRYSAPEESHHWRT